MNKIRKYKRNKQRVEIKYSLLKKYDVPCDDTFEENILNSMEDDVIAIKDKALKEKQFQIDKLEQIYIKFEENNYNKFIEFITVLECVLSPYFIKAMIKYAFVKTKLKKELFYIENKQMFNYVDDSININNVNDYKYRKLKKIAKTK